MKGEGDGEGEGEKGLSLGPGMYLAKGGLASGGVARGELDLAGAVRVEQHQVARHLTGPSERVGKAEGVGELWASPRE